MQQQKQQMQQQQQQQPQRRQLVLQEVGCGGSNVTPVRRHKVAAGGCSSSRSSNGPNQTQKHDMRVTGVPPNYRQTIDQTFVSLTSLAPAPNPILLCCSLPWHGTDVQVGGTLPGGLVVRGMSGGERRQLSIAVGVLGSPLVLFLDEPTSGVWSPAPPPLLLLLPPLLLVPQML